MSFSPADYGPVFGELLDVDRLRDLDEGSPQQRDRERLNAVSVDSAFGHARVVDNGHACCCISGVWLLYDFLDESHTISQNIASAEGSFWHGIMHRREGDYSNAKYWFRQVGQHPVYEQIADDWDPYDFVDACQVAIRNGGDRSLQCRELQQVEWERLFGYCYARAVGR